MVLGLALGERFLSCLWGPGGFKASCSGGVQGDFDLGDTDLGDPDPGVDNGLAGMGGLGLLPSKASWTSSVSKEKSQQVHIDINLNYKLLEGIRSIALYE